MPFIPVHDAHAIDKVSAAITFTANPLISSQQWLAVVRAVLSVADDVCFNDFQEALGTAITLNVAPGAPVEARTQIWTGVGFKLSNPEGAILADFMAMRQEIRVDLHAYVRWRGFRDLLRSILPPLIAAYPPSYTIAQLRLEYWDRFQSPDRWSPWSDLFRADGRLPPWPLTEQGHWHAHVGWFEAAPDGRRRLLNLNVDTSDQAALDTQIQTAAIYTLSTTVGEVLPVTTTTDAIFQRLDELHDSSKKAVGEVLTPAMAGRISLFSASEVS